MKQILQLKHSATLQLHNDDADDDVEYHQLSDRTIRPATKVKNLCNVAVAKI